MREDAPLCTTVVDTTRSDLSDSVTSEKVFTLEDLEQSIPNTKGIGSVSDPKKLDQHITITKSSKTTVQEKCISVVSKSFFR